MRWYQPRLVAVPGFTSGDGVTANPVVAELVGVLDKLRAVGFVDGPDTDDATALLYRGQINSQRIYVVDPKVLVWDTETSDYIARPALARFAGVQARVDKTLGILCRTSLSTGLAACRVL
ncbi:MAG: phage tail sheath protein FI [Paracoccaceae bacterium]|jgi:phage tail sheath protein FI